MSLDIVADLVASSLTAGNKRGDSCKSGQDAEGMKHQVLHSQ